MTRAKEILAPALSLVLAFGCVPVRAAELARGVALEVAAPAPIVALRGPLAAPSLSASLSAAMAASVPIAARPLAASEPLAAAPAPAIPAAAASVASAVPSADETSSARRTLQSLDGRPNAAPIYDGGGRDSGLPVDFEPSAPPPPLGRPGPARRAAHFLWGKPGSVERQIKNGVLAGALSGLVLPSLLKMRPLDFILMQSILPVAAAAVWMFAGAPLAALWRLAARSAFGEKPSVPAGVRVRRLAAASAVALGLALSLAPHIARDSFIEKGYPLIQRHVRVNINGRAYDPHLRLVGPALSRELVADMTANAEGRSILRELTDVVGRLDMPSFFVFTTPDDIGDESQAAYFRYADIVLISDKMIARQGWTMDEFLADAGKQAEFVDRNQMDLAHESVHAAQDRRSPFFKTHYHVDTYEAEYEAYVRQHLYRHEMLKQDPSRKDFSAGAIAEYVTILDDGLQPYLDRYLNALQYRMIADHVSYPPYDRLLKRVQSTWREHRIEGYELLAKRFAGTPDEKRFDDKAAALRAGASPIGDARAPSQKRLEGPPAARRPGWTIRVRVDAKGFVVDADWKDPAAPMK